METLVVSDLSGRRVASIHGPAGSRLVWEGVDAAGQRVPQGIYLYRVEAGRLHREGKIVVVR